MHVDPYIVLGSAVVGLLVGLTGAGGGALMTPMLILLFGIKPSTAISSDLVAAVIMRPFGAAVHIRKGTVNFRLVGWLVCGSVPMAFVGAYLLHLLGNGSAAQSVTAQDRVETVLGAALLIGAAAMVLRYVLDWRSGQQRLAKVSEITARPALTIAIGAIGGLIVGMTSVGSGSLMIVLMLFLYPMLSAGQLVGTDLTQAVPLTLAAACGALLFGHVQFAVTASIVIGSIPAVLVGSFLSSRAPDKVIRPIITFVIFASGLKYAGVGTTALGWILVIVLLGGLLTWLAIARPWRNGSTANGRTADGSANGSAADGSAADGSAADGSAARQPSINQLSNSVGDTGGPPPSDLARPALAEDRVVPVDGLEAADGDHVGEHG
ncbi:MAG: sulfite exporter TauE/SafE family protein [Streptosporangiaceae bacterium]